MMIFDLDLGVALGAGLDADLGATRCARSRVCVFSSSASVLGRLAADGLLVLLSAASLVLRFLDLSSGAGMVEAPPGKFGNVELAVGAGLALVVVDFPFLAVAAVVFVAFAVTAEAFGIATWSCIFLLCWVTRPERRSCCGFSRVVFTFLFSAADEVSRISLCRSVGPLHTDGTDANAPMTIQSGVINPAGW